MQKKYYDDKLKKIHNKVVVTNFNGTRGGALG
jgi:hypothetical protein